MVGERIVPPVDVGRHARSGASPGNIGQHLAEAQEFAAVYLAAQAKRIQIGFRNVFLFTLLGVFFMIVIATIAIVSVVLVCEGAAGGIGELLWGRKWAGDLITGSLVLGGALLFGWRLIAHVRKISKRQTISSYLKAKVPRS